MSLTIVDGHVLDPYTAARVSQLFQEIADLGRAQDAESAAAKAAIWRRCKIRVRMILTDHHVWIHREIRRKEEQIAALIASCPELFIPDESWSG